MKKEISIVAIFLALVLIPSVFAATVSTLDKGSVVIRELGNPAVFDFTVTGGADTYELYSFQGVSFSPRGTFDLASGTQTFEAKVYPSQEVLGYGGFYKFGYQLKGQNAGILEGQLTLKVVPLAQVLAVTTENLETSDDVAHVTIENTQNTKLENVKVSVNSPFFSESSTLNMQPYEIVVLNVTVDKEKQKSMVAGQYVILTDVIYNGAKARTEGTLEYVEEEKIVSQTQTEGFIVKKTTITKTNEGNIRSDVNFATSRDAISRLFTTFSQEPLQSERKGFGVQYIWESSLQPGESMAITVSTNYTFPLIILILIIVVVVLVKTTTEASVKVRKHVSFVKTKGGEFALKVTLNVSTDKHVENLQLIDNIPAVAKLYHQYGKMPDRMDANSRRLYWNVDKLNAGEARVYSYIIYSTIRVVGRFELPSAVAVFEKDGKTHEVYSNRAFFATETMSPGSSD